MCKRSICCITFSLILMILSTSCSNHQVVPKQCYYPTEIYIAGMDFCDTDMDSVPSLDTTEVKDEVLMKCFSLQEEKKQNIPERNVNLFGTEFSVEYRSSFIRPFSDRMIDGYSTLPYSSEHHCGICYYSDTNEIAAITVSDSTVFIAEKAPESEEDFLAVCKQIFEEMNLNIAEYTYTCVTQLKNAPGTISDIFGSENGFIPICELEEYPYSRYDFSFNRYIGGIKTNDYIYIHLNYDGSLHFVFANGMNDYKPYYDISIDKESCDTMVSEKAEKLFENTIYQDIEYKKEEKLVTLDEKLYLLVTLRQPEEQKNEEGDICRHFEVNLLLPLEVTD